MENQMTEEQIEKEIEEFANVYFSSPEWNSMVEDGIDLNDILNAEVLVKGEDQQK